MRVVLAAVGKCKASPELQLFTQYAQRLSWKLELKEVEPKKSLSGPARMEEEARLLLEASAGAGKRVLLDERGKPLSSRELAEQLKAWQVGGDSSVAFLIGGADGVTEALRQRADLMLSFGRLSWPHMLARAMLAEQLYRAQTIISGHPYHRD